MRMLSPMSLTTLLTLALAGCTTERATTGAPETGPSTEKKDCDKEWFYRDSDGDTYGDKHDKVKSCAAPTGYVSDKEDCDDTSAAIYPGAAEVCNGVDDDCDRHADDEDWYYRDSDGDTYGNKHDKVKWCEAPTGYVAEKGDCDDTSAAVHPDAAETCNGVDDDCDRHVDNDVIFSTYYADADGDGYGGASTTSACAAPSGYTTTSTDCDDANAAANPGASEVCNTIDDDCDTSVDEGVTSTFYVDADADGFGGAATTDACASPSGYTATPGDCDDSAAATSPIGTESCGDGVDQDCSGSDEACTTTCADLTCDGVPDVLFSRYGNDPYDYGVGAYLYASGDPATRIDIPVGEGQGDLGVSDFNHDGYLDIAMAIRRVPGGGASTTGYVYYGSASGYSTSHRDSLATHFPWAMRVADLDQDGWDDIVFGGGDFGYDTDVYYGGASGFSTPATLTTNYVGAIQAADFDGDGEIDLAFVDYNASYTGEIRFIYGDGARFAAAPVATLDVPDIASMHAADLDLDGWVDIVVPRTGAESWVLWGGAAGFDIANRTAIPSISANNAATGDLDGDGWPDLVLSQYADASGDADGGASQIWYGGPTGLTEGPSLPTAGALDIAIADLDGDGSPDIALGVAAATSSWTTPARVWYNEGGSFTSYTELPAGYGSFVWADGQDTTTPLSTGTCVDVGGACGATLTDADGDGYNDTIDCDDADAAVSPAATEIPGDGVDQDCDGSDGACTASDWFADIDGDGYGDAADTVSACAAPSGYVDDATDCDDTTPAVNPGATETCNTVDDDCDGTVDDGIGAATFYADADGDGFGDASAPVTACAAPAGTVTDGTDCDDGHAAAHPGAAEVCDALDNDCDALVDDSALDAPTFYADADGDGFGDATVSVTACAAPTGYVGDATDCDGGDAAVHPAAADTPDDGIDQDCSGVDATCRETGTVDPTVTGGLWGDVGDYAFASWGHDARPASDDLTGDGVPDLVVGAGHNDDVVYNGGVVYIVPGPVPVSGDVSALAVATIYGTSSEDYVGALVTPLGDVNSDGFSDLAVGGRVFYGPLSGDRSIDDHDAAFHTTYYDPRGVYAQWLTRVPDLDEDGVDEMALAYSCTDYPTCDGHVFLVSGAELGSGATLDESSPGVLRIVGTTHGGYRDYLGQGISSGDLNGDLVPDVAISAFYGNRTYVFDGTRIADDWATGVMSESAPTAAMTIIDGYETSGALYTYAPTVGDFDGDGIADLFSAANGGFAGLFYGPLTASSYDMVLDGYEAYLGATSDEDARFSGVSTDWSVSATDVDGDGNDDVIFGTSVFYGPFIGDLTGALADASWSGGNVVVPIGDVDGDGLEDLVSSDYASGGRGVLYLVGSVAAGLVGDAAVCAYTTDADRDGYDTAADCDDADADVHPGATELCGDAVDENCDGDASDGCPLSGTIHPADIAATIPLVPYAEMAAFPDYDADGGDELQVGSYIMSYPFGASPSASDAITTFSPGGNALPAGDLDDDGDWDVAVSEPTASGTSGRVWLFNGPLPTDGTTLDDTDAFAVLSGTGPYEYLGWSFGGGSDVTGDAVDDLVVGGLTGMYVVPGPITSATLTTPLLPVGGYLPYTTSPIDFDGDGLSDVVASLGFCPISGCSSHGGATVAVVWGDATVTSASYAMSDLRSADHANGVVLRDVSGFGSHFTKVAPAGDSDGDGRADLLVMDRPNNTLAIYSLDSTRAGTITETDFIHMGGDPLSAVAIDLDADLYMDVAFTSYQASVDGVAYSGALWAYQAPATGSITDVSTTDPVFAFVGDLNDGVGWGLAAGDWDGDGAMDLATSRTDGTVYLLYPGLGL